MLIGFWPFLSFIRLAPKLRRKKKHFTKMSAYAFSNPHPLKTPPPPNPDIIKKMLLENEELIKTIYDYQKRGKVAECLPLQKVLHRNLVYLATLADANVKMDSAVMTTELNGVGVGIGGGGAKNVSVPAVPATGPSTSLMESHVSVVTPVATTPISTAPMSPMQMTAMTTPITTATS